MMKSWDTKLQKVKAILWFWLMNERENVTKEWKDVSVAHIYLSRYHVFSSQWKLFIFIASWCCFCDTKTTSSCNQSGMVWTIKNCEVISVYRIKSLGLNWQYLISGLIYSNWPFIHFIFLIKIAMNKVQMIMKIYKSLPWYE